MARLGMTLLLGVAAGAAAKYFLDSGSGAKRRDALRNQARRAVATAKPGPSDDKKHDELGDAGLARKVESEIFRPADAPKGRVDVNAENGVVFLRGEVDREWIDRLGGEAEHVTGVKAVRNLLHAPGTPAPTTPGVS